METSRPPADVASSSLPSLNKVLAYITRLRGGGYELLVFRHRDFPEAGVQVPAGTVEPDEDLVTALMREVEEETGVGSFKLARLLGAYDWQHPDTLRIHHRHVYHLVARDGVPDGWEWVETSGGAVPDEEGYVFQYYWMPLSNRVELAGDQGDLLPALISSLRP